MAVQCNSILTLILYLLHVGKSLHEQVLGHTTDDFDFDGLPGAQHEFKIEIPAGVEECFVQKAASGANLHVSFEVLRGGDRQVGFFLRNNYGHIIEHHPLKTDAIIEYKAESEGQTLVTERKLPLCRGVANEPSILFHMLVKPLHWVLNDPDAKLDLYLKDQSGGIIQSDTGTSSADISKDIEVEGDYQICIDNTYARFSSKLVYVYIVTFVLEEWSKYVQEVDQVNTAVVNFTTSISAVEMSIETMKMHQTHSRMNVIKDWYLITGNNDYVLRWSILQIVVILTCSIFQVYFVRRLFKVSNVTPSAKPRA